MTDRHKPDSYWENGPRLRGPKTYQRIPRCTRLGAVVRKMSLEDTWTVQVETDPAALREGRLHCPGRPVGAWPSEHQGHRNGCC